MTIGNIFNGPKEKKEKQSKKFGEIEFEATRGVVSKGDVIVARNIIENIQLGDDPSVNDLNYLMGLMNRLIREKEVT